MEDLERKARSVARMAEEAAKELAKPKPLLSELFGDVGRIEMYGRGDDGERFIVELGPPTRIAAQTLPKEPNPNREVLWEARTWDNWSIQLVHYSDSHKVYLFMSHGPHFTAKLLRSEEVRFLESALKRAARRIEKGRKADGPSEKARNERGSAEEETYKPR